MLSVKLKVKFKAYIEKYLTMDKWNLVNWRFQREWSVGTEFIPYIWIRSGKWKFEIQGDRQHELLEWLSIFLLFFQDTTWVNLNLQWWNQGSFHVLGSTWQLDFDWCNGSLNFIICLHPLHTMSHFWLSRQFRCGWFIVVKQVRMLLHLHIVLHFWWPTSIRQHLRVFSHTHVQFWLLKHIRWRSFRVRWHLKALHLLHIMAQFWYPKIKSQGTSNASELDSTRKCSSTFSSFTSDLQ